MTAVRRDKLKVSLIMHNWLILRLSLEPLLISISFECAQRA